VTVTVRLQAALDELERAGWHVDPVDPDAPDTELAGRLVEEMRRVRVMREWEAQRARAVMEGQ
jgi:hypothetical protein